MIRWFDGLYGGLLAATTTGVFYAVVPVGWLHETTFAEFFAQLAQALPPLHAAPPAAPVVALGVVLHLLFSAACGVLYAGIAAAAPSTGRAPASIVWGLSFGLLVWWVLHDVLVPLTGAIDVQPLWEGLAGSLLGYGVVLSEYMAVARRRRAVPA